MPTFSAPDLERLKRLHPELQRLFKEAIKQTAFTIRDTNRGRADQEKAFKGGFSKVHYPDSAHNWQPSLAADIYPAPVDLADTAANRERFRRLQIDVLKPLAKKLGIPIRQGIDFNMNSDLTDDKFKDLPHIELHVWREWAAKDCKPYEG